MDWFKYVVVGSGPSGVAAALRLEGQGVCIVDVGNVPAQKFPHASLKKGLEAGDFASMLGPQWEMLANLTTPTRIHAKLRAAGVRYVASGHPFVIRNAEGEICLTGTNSHAAGGMSNAWGAQLFRYTNADLAEAGNWPIDATALNQYYVDLESHIGIAGVEDDAHTFLGDISRLLPPVPIAPAANHLLKRYQIKKKHLHLKLGRSRLAVLTMPYRGYPAHDFNETEFFSTKSPGIYTASRTLSELRTGGKVDYLGGYECVAFRENAESVEIDLLHIESKERRTIHAKHLLLGCGTQQTARLVLQNKNGQGKELPFIDHPPTLLPLFIPRMFGTTLPEHSFPVQLVATLKGYERRDMISFYYPGGMLWSDMLSEIPLPMEAALRIMPHLLGGMLVAQIWEASKPDPGNCLYLDSSGSIQIQYSKRTPFGGLNGLISSMRVLGAYTFSRLARMESPGWGFHYAGCLPMSLHPKHFETHVDGRLWDSQRIRVIDGSVFPSLPAKNHSLTLMANAARIAVETLKCEY